MTKKTLTCVLLLFLALGASSTSAASETTLLADPLDDRSTEIEQAGNQLLLATSGGKASMSCLGTIAGITALGLIVGAATGGAGLAIIGAYAPLAVVVCV